MTKFQLGLVIGFFLGGLTVFLVMGIIQLYIEEQQKKDALARKRIFR